ncbi:MAG TPA: hypothetical protein VFQ45_15550 [Longimicrobium sp.]|nr:hypothetical protein [Longimicrobium sp.]
MNKLKLEIDDLRVESFRTVEDVRARGTVVGACDTVHDPVCAGGTFDPTCEYADTCGNTGCRCETRHDSCGLDTCHDSCAYTCKHTCMQSCWGGCESLTDCQAICECPY